VSLQAFIKVHCFFLTSSEQTKSLLAAGGPARAGSPKRISRARGCSVARNTTLGGPVIVLPNAPILLQRSVACIRSSSMELDDAETHLSVCPAHQFAYKYLKMPPSPVQQLTICAF
jgi:hypothetical protein